MHASRVQRVCLLGEAPSKQGFCCPLRRGSLAIAEIARSIPTRRPAEDISPIPRHSDRPTRIADPSEAPQAADSVIGISS